MKQLTKTLTATLLLAVTILSLSACNGGGGSDEYTFLNTLQKPSFITDQQPQTEEPVEPDQAIKDKIADAYKQNDHVVGWLSMPGIEVDQPVVQTKDNDYYVRKGLDKKYNYLGILFADYECTMGDRKKLSRNTIIYGHNVDDDRKTGKMFAQMINYDKVEFAQANQFITYASPDDEMKWVVFAAFYCESSLAYIYPDQTDKEFKDLMTEVFKRTEINTGIEVDVTDKILTLSTCTYKYGSRKDQRFVVMARLLRPGEKEADFSTITKNPSPKAPQF